MRHMRDGVIAPLLILSVLDGGERLVSRPFHFTPVEISSGTHYRGTCLDGQEKTSCRYKESNSIHWSYSLSSTCLHNNSILHFFISGHFVSFLSLSIFLFLFVSKLMLSAKLFHFFHFGTPFSVFFLAHTYFKSW
jgi:hypothetical protein